MLHRRDRIRELHIASRAIGIARLAVFEFCSSRLLPVGAPERSHRPLAALLFDEQHIKVGLARRPGKHASERCILFRIQILRLDRVRLIDLQFACDACQARIPVVLPALLRDPTCRQRDFRG